MRKSIDKKMKYITGGVAALAMSVAACAAGTDARNAKNADAGAKFDAGTVLNETELEAETATDGDASTDYVSDDELVDKLTSSVDVSEKDIVKDETVYAFADASGKTTDILVNEVLKNPDGSATLTDKTDLTDIENVKGDEEFTQDGDTITWQANGNDITYQGKSSKSLPVDVAVSYYLDGNEVSPSEIAGKSGKVKIRFDYTNNETVVKEINGRDEDINVPFVAVTGMVLGDNFSNVTVTNGRSVSQGDSNIVIGFGMPGLMDSIKATSEDFSEDVDVPDYFEVEADVTDFSLDMTATVVVDGSAMNISGEIDTESLDDMMDSLSDATAQLVDGTGELSDGVATLLEKMGEFDAGVGSLKAGIDTLASKSGSLIDGIGTIDASAQSISNAIATLDTALNTPMTAETEKQISAQASSAAESAASSQMATNTPKYNEVKTQASESFAAKFKDTEKQTEASNEAKSKMNMETNQELNTLVGIAAGQLEDSVYDGLVTAYATGIANALGYTDDTSVATFVNSVKSDDQYSGVRAVLKKNAEDSAYKLAYGVVSQAAPEIASGTAKGVMEYIAENYAGDIGDSVAAACGNAAVEAAGQAAGEAVVTGVNTAKQQIATQIEATQANGYSLVTGAKALAAGTATLDSAAPALSDGIAALQSGANTLANGSSQLVDGVSTLNDGALTLKDGMQTYDTDAISKIVNSYNGDIKSLVERLSAVASASSEYDTFTMHEDGVGATTKFIIKTAGIEADTASAE